MFGRSVGFIVLCVRERSHHLIIINVGTTFYRVVIGVFRCQSYTSRYTELGSCHVTTLWAYSSAPVTTAAAAVVCCLLLSSSYVFLFIIFIIILVSLSSSLFGCCCFCRLIHKILVNAIQFSIFPKTIFNVIEKE